MAETSFNVIEWARRMGLKNVTDFPFRREIQPTVSLGEFGGLTPIHTPPSAISGGQVSAIAVENPFA